MSTQIGTLHIGYIHDKWDCNESGEQVIECGDAETSRVAEVTLIIEDGDEVRAYSDSAGEADTFSGGLDALCDEEDEETARCVSFINACLRVKLSTRAFAAGVRVVATDSDEVKTDPSMSVVAVRNSRIAKAKSLAGREIGRAHV